jgi:recombinational DNA repair protein (RecF pathway)
LKTELELAQQEPGGLDETTRLQILQSYKKITTTGAANAYIQAMGAKIEAARKKFAG